MIFQAPRHFHIESFCLKYPSLAEKLLLIFQDPRKTFLHIKSFLCPPPRSLIPVFYSSKAHCSLFRHGHAYFILCRTIKSAINLNRTFPAIHLHTDTDCPPLSLGCRSHVVGSRCYPEVYGLGDCLPCGSHHCCRRLPGHPPRPPGIAQSPRLSSPSEAREKARTDGTLPHPPWRVLGEGNSSGEKRI